MKIMKLLSALLLSVLLASQALAYQPINPNGQALGSASQPVVLAAPNTVVASAFTRPSNTTAYSTGNMFANSTTYSSVVPISFGISPSNGVPVYILKANIKTQTSGGAGVSITGGAFRLHLFGQSPTIGSSGGDGAAFNGNVAMTYWCGSLDGTLAYQGTDFSVAEMVPTNGSYVGCTPASGSINIYGLLEIKGAFTPTSAESTVVSVTAQ